MLIHAIARMMVTTTSGAWQRAVDADISGREHGIAPIIMPMMQR